jgi:hypothetical protein
MPNADENQGVSSTMLTYSIFNSTGNRVLFQRDKVEGLEWPIAIPPL